VPRVPSPPVDRFGLPELAAVEQMSFAGITFIDTFFLRHDQASESLHFHELVHVVHWDRFGVDNTLLAYGAGLVRFGYEQSPLEQLAYSLQWSFDNGTLPRNLVGVIETRTNAIWARVAPILQSGGGSSSRSRGYLTTSPHAGPSPTSRADRKPPSSDL